MAPVATPDPIVTCSQNGCTTRSVARYTWPGRDEAGICAEHLPKLQGVAKALGLYLQIIPIDPEDDDG